MHSFPTERARLKVRNPAGEVHVETADVAETTVELVPLDGAESTKLAIEAATVEARGDEVVVELAGRSWTLSIGDWSLGRSPKVGVRIRCPHASDLDCDTASASVTSVGRLGDVRIRTASGDLALGHVAGRLRAKSASGEVQVEQVDGVADVQTVSGDVDLRAAGSELTVSSISADVQVGSVSGSLTITSVSGDQRVAAAGSGDVQLKAVSGDIDVALRSGLRIRLDVNSVSGGITSELDVGDAPPSSDGPEIELRARTVSGDVRIRRAHVSESASARIALA